MIHLVIDIGNTFTKVAIFNNRDVVESFVYEGFGLTEIKEIVDRHPIDRSIISSVDRDIADLELFLNANSRYLRFHAGIPTQIKNHYKTPQTLGLDRLAGVIGARSIFPGKNSLVIDAGTCITYDFIDSGANYRGGSISPGLAMRFTAMNAYTERLPLVELDPEYNFIRERIQTQRCFREFSTELLKRLWDL